MYIYIYIYVDVYMYNTNDNQTLLFEATSFASIFAARPVLGE